MSLESPALFYLDGPWSGDQAHAKIGSFCGQEIYITKKHSDSLNLSALISLVALKVYLSVAKLREWEFLGLKR